MKLKFALAATLVTALDQSAGTWTTVRLQLSVADMEGVYTGIDAVVGDAVVLDTGSFEPGSTSRYTITSFVGSKQSASITVNATRDAADNPAPDLSYCVGTRGVVARPTATNGLLPVPSPGVQQLPDKLAMYAINGNTAKTDTLSGGVGGATNLTTTANATTVTVLSDTGTDATLAAATTSAAGVMSAADKTKLNSLGVPPATLTGVTYDGSSRVTGYTKDGSAYTVAYPSSTSITVAGGGKTTTITLDAQGRITGMSVA